MIPTTRRNEVLAWLDDRARDYSLSNREIALAKDAATLIRERDDLMPAGSARSNAVPEVTR